MIFLVFATVSLGAEAEVGRFEGKRRSVAASPANWQVGPYRAQIRGGPSRAPEDGKWGHLWWTPRRTRWCRLGEHAGCGEAI